MTWSAVSECVAIAMPFRARKWVVWHLTLGRLGHEGRLWSGWTGVVSRGLWASSLGGLCAQYPAYRDAGGPWA
jgi:hypothetical protein